MEKDGELIVMKSNRLIQDFKFSLSKTEMRIVNFIIANISSPLYDQEFNTLEFYITDFYKALGVEKPDGNEYKYLKSVIKGLRDKSSDYVRIGDCETVVSWIEKPRFYEKSGRVTLKLDDDLKPYLLQMNGYIQAQLNYYYQMTSKYSMRLYELLKSWEKVGKKEFGVDELRLSIDASQKSYKNYSNFEIKALKPAVDEINEITDLRVSYTKKTRGKKVVSIEFLILTKKNRNISEKVKEKCSGVQESFDDPASMDEYMASFQNECIKTDDGEAFCRSRYNELVDQFPMFSGKQIEALFLAAIKHVDVIGLSMSDKQEVVAAYIRPKLRRIEATPDETRSTVFNRLLNLVEKNY